MLENALLFLIETSCWKAQLKIDPRNLAEDVNPDAVRATKRLLAGDHLKPLTSLISQARRYLREKALPFPMEGVHLVPQGMLGEVDEKMKEIQAAYHAATDAFLAEYPSLIEQAAAALGRLFDPSDYPCAAKVASKFGFGWRYFHITVPNGQFSLLSPEMYERERRKLLDTIEEARSLSVTALRSQFAGLVDHLVDRLTGTDGDGRPKIFKASTVENLSDFIRTFENRNIFADEELQRLVAKANAALAGAAPEDIRNDHSLRDIVRSRMNDVHAEIDKIHPPPRRRLDL